MLREVVSSLQETIFRNIAIYLFTNYVILLLKTENVVEGDDDVGTIGSKLRQAGPCM